MDSSASVWCCASAPARTKGRYSVERLCELHEYTQRTSRVRAFLVLALAVVPSLLAIVVLDAIALQDPYGGYDRNAGMWVRLFLGMFILSIGVMCTLQSMVPAAALSPRQCVAISFLAAAVSELTLFLIARAWVFPIPFMMLVADPPWAITMTAATYIVVGPKRIAASPVIRTQLQRYVNFTNFSSAFLVIFPTYSVVFKSLDGVNQFAFVFVLPVLKFVLKRVARVVVGDIEELVPLLVVTVDLFNALFQAKCVQTSGSAYTTAGIIAIDAVQNLYTLWKLRRHMASVRDTVRFGSVDASTDLLSHCLTLLRTTPKQLELCALHVPAWTQSQLSPETAALIAKLKQLEKPLSLLDRHSSDCQRSDASSKRLALNAVVPLRLDDRAASVGRATSSPRSASLLQANDLVVPLHDSGGTATDALAPSPPKAQQERPVSPTITTPSVVLSKTLELLWRCESVLLVEYIESVAPLVFSLSMTILFCLPNAKYYPGMVAMSTAKLGATVASIVVYSALECLSLVYLHAALHRNFRVSALHQLAFVLEKQWLTVQGLFLTWVIVALSFTLEHYGTYVLLLQCGDALATTS